MKKQLFLLVMMLLPMVAMADDVEIDGIYYNLNTETKTAKVVGKIYSGSISIVIPETVTHGETEFVVTSIENFAFQNCVEITSITIPNSVTSIGEYAFYGCSGLLDMFCYAENVPTTGSNAFGWSNIANATLHVPASSVSAYKTTDPRSGFKEIVAIGGQDDEGGKEDEVGETETGIYAKNADGVIIYYNYINDGKDLEVTYKSDTEPSYSGVVNIPENVTYNGKTMKVTSIGERAFFACVQLVSVTIPNTVTKIRTLAIGGCDGLTSITIPASVNSMDQMVFFDCANLNTLTINSNSLVSKNYENGNNAISSLINTDAIRTVNIGEGVTGIGTNAFNGFSFIKMNTVTIPNSVKSIGASAFSECSSLTSVVSMMETPCAIDEDCFYVSVFSQSILNVPKGTKEKYKATKYWNKFTRIEDGSGDGGNESGETETGIYAKNADGVTIYYNYINDGKELEVTYKSLAEASYSGVVNIPESVTYKGKTMKVTSIGDNAFWLCNGVSAVSIPSSVTNLSIQAFDGNNNIRDVTINSNSLMSKDYDVFGPLSVIFSNAERLVIGEEVKRLGKNIFFDSWHLKSVTIGSNVTFIDDKAFDGCSHITTLIVNSNDVVSKNYTEKTSLIKVFGDLKFVTIGDKVTSIGDYAFYGCSHLLTLSMPNTIKTISDYAFYDCGFLNSLNLPNTLTTIGDNAFYGCVSIPSLTIPNSVKTIGDHAFYACVNLSSLTLGNSIERIEDYTFTGSSKMSELIIPESVTNIGMCAFGLCTSLKSVVIGNSVKTIGYTAFYKCSALSTVTLGRSVEVLTTGAFMECPSLTTINSYAVDPPSCGMLCFDEVDKDHCTVYVPVGSSGRYKDANEWKNFKIIKESESLSASHLNADEAEAVGVYDMSGHRLNSLQHGINVVRMSNGSVKKVVVK